MLFYFLFYEIVSFSDLYLVFLYSAFNIHIKFTCHYPLPHTITLTMTNIHFKSWHRVSPRQGLIES